MTEVIKPTLQALKANFETGITRPLEWRKQQMRQMIKGINEMKDELE